MQRNRCASTPSAGGNRLPPLPHRCCPLPTQSLQQKSGELVHLRLLSQAAAESLQRAADRWCCAQQTHGERGGACLRASHRAEAERLRCHREQRRNCSACSRAEPVDVARGAGEQSRHLPRAGGVIALSHTAPLIASGVRGCQVVAGEQRRELCVRAASAVTGRAAPESPAGDELTRWLQEHGAPTQKVAIENMDIQGRNIDVLVAAEDLEEGEAAVRIPQSMVVTLDSVLGNETVAELLTTNKLSELAVLALYMMYEKKRGKGSFWHAYIKELDRIRARSRLAVESPLLWEEEEVERLLAGSPVVEAVQERLRGVRKEYEELDTVWFMAGSLFQNYPYEIPSEQFSFELFKQAFAVVQACVVHLQGVPLAKRFALVPLGPPLMSYCSTCKAMLVADEDKQEVVLRADRRYKRGDLLLSWCGPQPNMRLLLNYGIVDEGNPYDKMALTFTLAQSDPLYQSKRAVLQQQQLTTQHVFYLLQGKPLDPNILAFLRLAAITQSDMISSVAFGREAQPLADAEMEAEIVNMLIQHLKGRLAAYRTTVQQDVQTLMDPDAGPREKVAARLLRIEKTILGDALSQLCALPQAPANSGRAEPAAASEHSLVRVKIS